METLCGHLKEEFGHLDSLSGGYQEKPNASMKAIPHDDLLRPLHSGTPPPVFECFAASFHLGGRDPISLPDVARL